MRSALVRYHEIALKKGNRAYFVEHLKRNLSTALRGMGLKEIRNASSRLLLNFNHDVSRDEVDRPARPGLRHRQFLPGGAYRRRHAGPVGTRSLEALQDQSFDSFRIETRRVDKRFPLTSNDINRELGALVQARSGAQGGPHPARA